MTSSQKTWVVAWASALAVAGLIAGAAVFAYSRGFHYGAIDRSVVKVYKTESKSTIESRAIDRCSNEVNHLNGSNFNTVVAYGNCVATIEKAFSSAR